MTELTDECLREIAESNPRVLAIYASIGEPTWADVLKQNAVELLAARAEIRRLRAIEAAAREVCDNWRLSADTRALLRARLGAALAAKETP